MKVYFSTSISQMTDQTKKNSLRILSFLQEKKYHIVSSDLLQNFESSAQRAEQSEDQALVAQKNLTRLKKQADIVVFEVSRPSLGVGQEINIALLSISR